MCDYFAQQRIMEGSSSPAEEGCTCNSVKLSKIKGCGKAMFGDDGLEYICGESLWDGDKIRLCLECSKINGDKKNG